jgi:glycosyltransferase involved in cell wall biosynthesis
MRNWVIGCVALFRPRKGLEILLAALAKLRNQGVSVTLRAVGPFETAQYRSEIDGLVTHLNLEKHITWTDYQPDINKELSVMDIFVLPSLFGEGMPMVILEAMAMGIPVVASCVEGVPEAVTDGVTGCLVAPGDPNRLANSIKNLILQPSQWEKIRRNAYQRQADDLSDERMARRVAEIYDHVLRLT